MRLLIVGTLEGQLTAADQDRDGRAAPTSPMPRPSTRRSRVLRAGRGADLLMVDVALDIARPDRARSRPSASACRSSPAASSTDARAAVAAIRAGAKEYIPLPPDPELIAAVLAAVADDTARTDLARRRHGARDQARRPDRAVRRLDADHRRKRHRQGGDRALRAQPLEPRARRRSSRSTARRSRRTCWNPSCSATRRAPSPARSRAASASSRRRPAARCCSTKSPRWTCGCRPSCCAPSRSA